MDRPIEKVAADVDAAFDRARARVIEHHNLLGLSFRDGFISGVLVGSALGSTLACVAFWCINR